MAAPDTQPGDSPLSDAFITPADWAAAASDDAAPAPADDAAPAPAGDEPLDDLEELFGSSPSEERPTSPDAPSQPPPTPAAEPSEDGATGELEELFSDDPPDGGHAAAPAGPPASLDVPSSVPADPAEQSPGPRSTVTSVRQSIADATDDDDAMQQAVSELKRADHWQAHRWHAGLDLYPYVDRILGLIGNDATMQARLAELSLTRDHAADRAGQELFNRLVRDALASDALQVTNPKDVPYVLEMSYDEWIGISVLGPLWRDDAVTEIMVDAWDKVVVERNGELVVTPARFRDLNHATSVARTLSEKVSDRAVNNSNPIVNAELPGARVNFAVGGIVKSGLAISMRKFVPLLGMEGLMRYSALNETMRRYLADCVTARANILVSGGTGTGKTTMINALSEYIPNGERVVTIEDTFELSLTNSLVVAMQTREPTRADAKTAISQSDLLINALRMRPDRIIVGEIREGRGAEVMLQAANTGHDGTMTTIHANDPVMAVDTRLPDMLSQATHMPADVARRQVSSAIDVVVQVTRRGQQRYISAIAEVDRRDTTGSRLEPYIIFEGDIGPDGPVYRQARPMRSDTDLAGKFIDAGLDPGRWATADEETGR